MAREMPETLKTCFIKQDIEKGVYMIQLKGGSYKGEKECYMLMDDCECKKIESGWVVVNSVLALYFFSMFRSLCTDFLLAFPNKHSQSYARAHSYFLSIYLSISQTLPYGAVGERTQD